MNWSCFSFDYRLELPGMMSVLVRIEGRKEAAMSLLLPSQWKEQLDVLNRIRTVHGSTALEGNPLSESQIADFLGARSALIPRGGNSDKYLMRIPRRTGSGPGSGPADRRFPFKTFFTCTT